MKESELEAFRERYRIPNTVEMFILTPDEQAYVPKEGCVAVSKAILSGGMKLPLHPFCRYMLRQYNLAPTRLVPNV